MKATRKGSRINQIALIACLALVSAVLVAAPASGHTVVEWVSVSNTGDPGNGDAIGFRQGISRSGRFVAFSSTASNLVENDDNSSADIFVHDRKTSTTTLVSFAIDGTPGNGDSVHPAISSDGRFVAFESLASDLITTDSNSDRDVFVRDRRTGTTTRVSVASDGSQATAPGFSAMIPSISGGGRFVVFNSESPDLVANDTNGAIDTFVHDRETSKTKRVSVRSNGAQADLGGGSGEISGDGRFVTFSSQADDLVDGDTNGSLDVFVHNRATGKTKRVSVRSNGRQGNEDSFMGAISITGRFIAFHSNATNLVQGDANDEADVFVHDRSTGKTTLESVTPDGEASDDVSRNPSLSGNGRLLAFDSTSSNLVPGDTNDDEDIFVRNLTTDKTRRVNLRANGRECDDAFFGSEHPFMSADGRFVVFKSDSTNLVPGDNDGDTDMFVAGPL